MWGVVGISTDQPDGSTGSTEFVEPETDVEKLSDKDPLKASLAACHSLTRIDDQLVMINFLQLSFTDGHFFNSWMDLVQM